MWLRTSGSYAQPPADAAGDPAQYGLIGGRVEGRFPWGALQASGTYGHAASDSGGRWLQGEATLGVGRRIGAVGLRARVSGFGLRYVDPFRYDAGGVEIHPEISFPVGRLVLSARPALTFGSWSTELVEGELRVAGGELEAYRSFGAVTGAVSAGATDVENGVTAGTFSRIQGRLILDRGRWTAMAQLEAQRTPLETAEIGGGVLLSWTVAPGMEVQGFAGHRVRDPLFGTAGSLNVSLTASFRAARWSPPSPPPVAHIGELVEEGRRVRFAIRAPGAEAVELTGDFTGWDPVAMEAERGGWWVATRVVKPGLHHFGFLVDGSWAIPEDAPGVVEDGWGRRNASIVVEP